MPFQFKQFRLTDGRSAMKLSTDAVLLGVFAGLRNTGTILDIGTGSGIIALMLAQRCDAQITGIDIDEGSVEDARQNFRESQWSDRLCAIHQNFQEYARNSLEKFDLIVSNPPYFMNSLRSPISSRNISKHNEGLSYPELVLYAHSLMKEDGSCCFIIPAKEGEYFCKMAAGKGLHASMKKWVQPRKSKKANRVLLELRAVHCGPAEETTLAIRNEDDSFTAEYQGFTKDFYLKF
jgi:tRNA1Val (adenine37-N6)-methyltransferase